MFVPITTLTSKRRFQNILAPRRLSTGLATYNSARFIFAGNEKFAVLKEDTAFAVPSPEIHSSKERLPNDFQSQITNITVDRRTFTFTEIKLDVLKLN